MDLRPADKTPRARLTGISPSEPIKTEPRGREIIEDAGRAVALGAVLLPVAGVLVRYIAFSAGQTVNHPLSLALAASPIELVATGFVSLVPGLLALPFIAAWTYFAPIQSRIDSLSGQLAQIRNRLKDNKAQAEHLGTVTKAQVQRLNTWPVWCERAARITN